MVTVLKASDIAISRSGSLSISEISASGVAPIFVPYPHAAADHQRKNAKFMVEKGAGLYIEDYKTAPAKLRVLYYDKNKDISKLEIKIHEGKNRQVRKMCKAINHPVLRLKRVAMGKITLNDCKVGEYRHLTEAEVNYLKSI